MATVHFHIGRGGRFHNAGHKSYEGEKTLHDVIRAAESAGQWSFLAEEDDNEREPGLYDANGNQLLTIEEYRKDTGTLNWDNDYDTDIVQNLEDCDESELWLIARSNEYKSGEVIAHLERELGLSFDKWGNIVEEEE